MGVARKNLRFLRRLHCPVDDAHAYSHREKDLASGPLLTRIGCLYLQAGVTDVVLAVNYRPEVMVALLSKCEEQYGIKITFSVESEPLGTGTCACSGLAEPVY